MYEVPVGFIFLPLARGRVATRAILWLVPTLLLGAAAFTVYGRIDLSPNAVSNGLVELAIAVGALPLPLLALFCGFRCVQHLLAVVWFTPLGVRAGPDVLELRFGPFGTASYPARELNIRYPFELSGDFDEGGFEHYLPEEEQIERLLPRIVPMRGGTALNQTMLKFLDGDEQGIARALRPAIELWRGRFAVE